MDTPPKIVQFLLDRIDYLKHFGKDSPGWKLAALVVIKLPQLALAIILGISYLAWRHPG